MEFPVWLTYFGKILSAYSINPSEFSGDKAKLYWDNLKEFGGVVWERAVEPLSSMPAQRLPSPAQMRAVCKEIQGHLVPEGRMEQLDELKRMYIEGRIQHMETITPTERMKVRIANLKTKLYTEFRYRGVP